MASGWSTDQVDELAARATTVAMRAFGSATVTGVRRLPGGLSSLTFRACLRRDGDDRPIVLKVAPSGVDPVRNRDVLRQARLIKALGAVTGVPVPDVLFDDPGDPPELPPLFAMSFVEGDSFEPLVDEPVLPFGPEVLRARLVAAAATLAQLHVSDPGDLGLAEEPAISLSAEIERWERALDTVPEELRPDHHAAARALRSSLPDPMPPVVSHGDWRLGNMLCAGISIQAVIDWEIWARADPRVDLAWFLGVNRCRGNPTAVRPNPPGLPSTVELLDVYQSALGVTVDDVMWFDALNSFKQAAILSLIVKHNRRAARPDPKAERHAAHAPLLIAHTLAALR